MKMTGLLLALLLISAGAGSAERYTANSNGTVTDNVTGLLWQQSDDNQARSLQEALDYCNAYSPDSHAWRLPNVKELKSIVDLGSFDPAMASIFAGTKSSNYWTSTSNAQNPYSAWFVFFYNGAVYSSFKVSRYYVRCVR